MKSIPKRFEAARVSEWPVDNSMRVVAEKYLNNFAEYYIAGQAPSFFGKSGRGKSRISAALLLTLQEITTPPVSIGWYPASESLNRLLDFRDLRMTDSYNGLWSDLKTTDIIVFDDISTLRSSPRVLEYFWMITEARYYDKKATIFTGNFEVQDTDLWAVLGKWFSDAFARRVHENSSGLTVLI